MASHSALTSRRQRLCALVCTLGLAAATMPSLAGPATQLRDDGVLLVDDEPFFPLGIYHAGMFHTDERDRYQNGLLAADIETIAEAGFNLIHVSMDHGWDGNRGWKGERPAHDACVRAAELGIYLADSVYLGRAGHLEVEAGQSHAKYDAILVTSLGDDFNSDRNGRISSDWKAIKYPPNVLRALHERVKKVAPGQVTYSSGSSFKSDRLVLEAYMAPPAVDLIAIQSYPIGDGNQWEAYEWEAMDDRCESYWRQAGATPHRAFIVNPQCFRWSGQRWITATEMRLQAFVTLLRRTRGLVWYTFCDSGGEPLDKANPGLWSEFRLLLPELKRLTPLLVNGAFTSVDNPDDPYYESWTGAGTWHAGYWKHAGALYVIIANTHKTETQSVDFALPNAVDGTATALFDRSRYGSGLTVKNGRIGGEVAGGDVHVYRIGRKPDAGEDRFAH